MGLSSLPDHLLSIREPRRRFSSLANESSLSHHRGLPVLISYSNGGHSVAEEKVAWSEAGVSGLVRKVVFFNRQADHHFARATKVSHAFQSSFRTELCPMSTRTVKWSMQYLKTTTILHIRYVLCPALLGLS